MDDYGFVVAACFLAGLFTVSLTIAYAIKAGIWLWHRAVAAPLGAVSLEGAD